MRQSALKQFVILMSLKHEYMYVMVWLHKINHREKHKDNRSMHLWYDSPHYCCELLTGKIYLFTAVNMYLYTSIKWQWHMTSLTVLILWIISVLICLSVFHFYNFPFNRSCQMSTLFSLYFFLRLSVVGTVYIAVVDVLQKKMIMALMMVMKTTRASEDL